MDLQAVKKERRKNIINALYVIIIFGVMLIGSVFFLLGPRTKESETEKRKTSEFPKFSVGNLFSGEFTNGITLYFSDTVPNRTGFLHASSDIRSYFGIAPDGMVIQNGSSVKNKDADKIITEPDVTTTVAVVIPVSTSAISPETTEITTKAVVTTIPVEPDDNLDIEDPQFSKGIMILGDRGIMMYGGNFNQGINYANYLNAFKADLGPDVNVYSMIAPTAQSFYMPEKLQKNYGSEPDNFTNIRNHLNGVIDINLIPVLEEHKDEDIYLKTDFHWSPLGAFYAAEAFAEAARVNFPSLSSYTPISREGYVGAFYGTTGVAEMKNFPETFTYYKPGNYSNLKASYYTTKYTNPIDCQLLWEDVSVSNSYIVFMGGDGKINDIKTNMGGGRTLAIFKDSYGNALQPCLTTSFERIITCDIRYFDLNAIDFLREQKVTDVLFCMDSFSATGPNANHIERIRVN